MTSRRSLQPFRIGVSPTSLCNLHMSIWSRYLVAVDKFGPSNLGKFAGLLDFPGRDEGVVQDGLTGNHLADDEPSSHRDSRSFVGVLEFCCVKFQTRHRAYSASGILAGPPSPSHIICERDQSTLCCCLTPIFDRRCTAQGRRTSSTQQP